MNCVSGTCDFDGGFCEWINLPLGDEFDWALNSGKTGTILTGPEKDHTGHDGKNTCFFFFFNYTSRNGYFKLSNSFI